MNKQFKFVKGVKVNDKIEWTDYTWNVVGGCQHACRWDMPDGSTAICYAESTAKALKSDTFFQHGFNHHYFHPSRLEEPLKMKTPSRIFLDSMSDLMGHWVKDEEIEAVLDIARRAPWHTFQLLTKNAPRLLKFDFPDNVWAGVSAPPSHMNGRPLSDAQRSLYVQKALDVMLQVKASTRWMSVEPLSYNISHDFWLWQRATKDENNNPRPFPLEWAVIGAATNGRTVYQPEPIWVSSILDALGSYNTPVFFKGNLRGNKAAFPWREEFPDGA